MRFIATGSFLLHAGVLFLVTGGLLQYYSGDQQSVVVAEGTQSTAEKFHVKIFLHDFTIIRNNKGAIINYRSNIEIRDTANHTLIGGVTMVNAPMRYHGLYLYQTNFGHVPDAVKNFRAFVTDSADDTLFCGTVPYKVIVSFYKDNLSLQCTDFLCDFYYDFENRMPMTRSQEHNNPAFKVILFRNGSALDSQWISPKFPSLNGRFGRYTVTIPSYEPLFYSGILVQKKPGMACIWIGIISVSIGMAIVFLSRFRKVP